MANLKPGTCIQSQMPKTVKNHSEHEAPIIVSHATKRTLSNVINYPSKSLLFLLTGEENEVSGIEVNCPGTQN